jgi:hypothetical protein
MGIVPASDKLTNRLRANWQRRQRELFLKSLPSHLANILSDAPFITDPDRTPFIQYFFVSEDGAGTVPKIKPPRYEYFDTGLSDRVSEFLRLKTPSLGNGPAILAFEQDLPCFRIRFESVAPLFFEFFPFAQNGMLLVAENLNFGAVVSSFCGYHPDDRENREITFEIAVW